MEAKEISQAVISRLPRYFRYLGELKDDGVERISSQELSTLMKVTASQIRQDFNNFGGFGQQGYGYNVEYLYSEISKILGLDKTHHLIIIGAGNLGQALANYMNFERRGFLFEGIFDALAAYNSGLTNVVACLGATPPFELIKDLDLVFCLDNDRTGYLNSVKYLKRGYKALYYPDSIKQKDMNDILNAGGNIKELILENQVSGILGEVKIKSRL